MVVENERTEINQSSLPELPPLGPARKELSVLFGHLKQLREHLLLEGRLLGVIAR